MTFPTLTDDIIVQEGTFAYNFTASGTVYAGQLVDAVGTMQVKAAVGISSTAIVGVAAYYATDGEKVAVYGPGNIVRCAASGTSVAAGECVQAGAEGRVLDVGSIVAKASGAVVVGKALESQSTADAAVRVLLI